MLGSSGSGGSSRSGRVGRASTTSSAVPVFLGVTEAVTNGNSLVAELGKGGEHVLSKVHGSLLVDVMSNLEPLVAGSGAAGDVAQENVLGVLDQSGTVVFIVISVKVEVCDVIAKISHVLLAA